jgi:uncharacterized membrane protein
LLTRRRTSDRRALAVTAAIAGVAVLDALTGFEQSRMEPKRLALGARHGIQVTRSITINRSAEDVNRFWRDFRNFPRFMQHIEAINVDSLDSKLSRWRAKAPGERTVEWTAEIVADEPGQMIAWRSLPGSDVPNEGAVWFREAPGERGTEIRVELRYVPPLGPAAAIVAKLFGEEPSQQVAGDLRRFKQFLETGDVARSDASIHSGMHPARPSPKPRTDGKATS